MATASIKGLMFQGDSPNWRPLLRHMDEELVGWFMWMFEVRTLDNRSLHAYKHSATRSYVHLDRQGRAYAYTRSGRYRPIAVAKALEEVFRDWGTLGATARELRLARLAVLRASGRVTTPAPGNGRRSRIGVAEELRDLSRGLGPIAE